MPLAMDTARRSRSHERVQTDRSETRTNSVTSEPRLRQPRFTFRVEDGLDGAVQLHAYLTYGFLEAVAFHTTDSMLTGDGLRRAPGGTPSRSANRAELLGRVPSGTCSARGRVGARLPAPGVSSLGGRPLSAVHSRTAVNRPSRCTRQDFATWPGHRIRIVRRTPFRCPGA